MSETRWYISTGTPRRRRGGFPGGGAEGPPAAAGRLAGGGRGCPRLCVAFGESIRPGTGADAICADVMPVVHDVRRDVSRPPPSDVHGVARRLDWRFLLPVANDAPLERLRLLGGDASTGELIVECGVAGTVVTEGDD